ncbi:MAG: Bax inhibitor-1/YccA family protein [Bacilli bacterium]|nr:Bax inhibitor-1/YccA family protein [Bacilli bacterium]MBR3049131.1 Bax inhibitor-1/YccA family protein [Bacilli bacterium]
MDNINRVYSKVFAWLFVGLLITFGTGYGLYLNKDLMITTLKTMYIPIIIIELAIALFLSFRITKMKPITTKILYILFTITTGITFSALFVVYELGSIIFIFLLTAIIFGVLAFYGYITKRDLTNFGVILLVTLLVIIVASILNALFFHSSSLHLGITILGVLVFMGFVVYDMQKIKQMLPTIGEEKAAVFGAFQLYLDFINLFIRLLELFGKKK